jgi:glycosyltransferase involved in cell wall biosynthesis
MLRTGSDGRFEVPMDERKKLIFFGVLPPPLHGQSRINQELVTTFAADTDLQIFDTSPGTLERSAGYYARKIARVLSCMLLLVATARPSHSFYISISSRYGLWIDVCVVLIARTLRCRTLLHHHAYNYIDKWSFAMSALARLAGPRATHIFACELMRGQFCTLYRLPIRALICSVAKFADASPNSYGRGAAGARPFRVGILSNLSADKGVYEFLSLVEEATKRRIPIVGVLAGPISSDVDDVAIRDAQSRSGEQLRYLGPLYGAEKDLFFKEIDVFLFPTKMESFGLVVVEALSHGVPVISFARGCIGAYLTEPAGRSIPPDAGFGREALRHVMEWMNDAQAYAEASRAAVDLGHRLRRQSEADFKQLVSLVVEQEGARQERSSADKSPGGEIRRQ